MKSLKSELQILVVFVGIMLASFSSNAYGISYMLHADSLLELQIAKDAPTRINIEGEKINDIFIHPQEAAEVAVHDSGCLFILPQQTQAKLYLTCNEMLSELLTLYGVETDSNKKNSLSNIVIDCARGLLDYSHNLVNLLQQDTKLVSIDLQAFDLEQLVNETVNKIIPEAKDKGLDLFCNFQYDIAKIIIGDSYWIGAILEQLVANAVKFTEEGKVIVTINLFPTTIAEDNKEMVLQLIIHDTGIGMSEEIQRYIRDKNTEFDSATGYKGLKLGLSFVKRLIHEMHGDINVESKGVRLLHVIYQ